MTETQIRDWTDNEKALWARLQAHPFEQPELGLDFARRLAREQGWTLTYARRAIDEYRRFCFLACVSDHELTPSDAVDEVWHLHLCYTRDYWKQFCPEVLGRALHHGPTLGGREESLRYREQYAQTIALYEDYFGETPLDLWPGTRERFAAKPAWITVEHGRYWLLPKPRWPGAASACAALLALATLLQVRSALALSSNPLDWTGGPFLQLYLALMVTALIGAWWLRRSLRETGSAGGARPDAFELAYLAGGAVRCTDAAVAHLLGNGHADWDQTGRELKLNGRAPDGSDPPAVVARCIAVDGSPAQLLKRSSVALAPLEKKLQQSNLWLDGAAAWRVRLFSALPVLLVAAFGLSKIFVGLSRSKPVAFLVILTVITGVIGLGLLLARPTRTRAGDHALADAKQRHARAMRAPQQKELGLAVALLGTAALSGTAYAQYHQLRSPPSSSGDSGGSGGDSGGGDGGGSGCGGCGGGD
ncbi:MAG: TIGR04222 domain-containing membrane protein [Lysobacterales bacterium]